MDYRWNIGVRAIFGANGGNIPNSNAVGDGIVRDLLDYPPKGGDK
jgi:hypothetical protein